MNTGELQVTLEFGPPAEDDRNAQDEIIRESESLQEWINTTNIAIATPLQVQTEKTTMGIEIVIGTIILTAIVNEGVRALFEYIKQQRKFGFQRRELLIRVEEPGWKFELKASHISDQELPKIVGALALLTSGG